MAYKHYMHKFSIMTLQEKWRGRERGWWGRDRDGQTEGKRERERGGKTDRDRQTEKGRERTLKDSRISSIYACLTAGTFCTTNVCSETNWLTELCFTRIKV